MAEVRKSGHAEIDIDAGNDIEIEDSTLISKVGRYGRADIEITSRHGDIEIEDSFLLAEVRRSGHALIDISARSHRGDVEIEDSTLIAKVGVMVPLKSTSTPAMRSVLIRPSY